MTGREWGALAAFAAIPAAASTPAASAAAALARGIAILASAVAMRSSAFAVHRLMIVAAVGNFVDLSGVLDRLRVGATMH